LKVREELSIRNAANPPTTGVNTDILSPDGATMTQPIPSGILPGPDAFYKIMLDLYPRLNEDINENTNITKTQLEDLLRKYMGQHYCLFFFVQSTT